MTPTRLMQRSTVTSLSFDANTRPHRVQVVLRGGAAQRQHSIELRKTLLAPAHASSLSALHNLRRCEDRTRRLSRATRSTRSSHEKYVRRYTNLYRSVSVYRYRQPTCSLISRTAYFEDGQSRCLCRFSPKAYYCASSRLSKLCRTI